MKTSTVNQIHKIQELTSNACKKDGYGCCSKFFCKVAEIEATALGFTPEKTENQEIPYLSEKGCVIPPQFRPGCAMYVCPTHLENRKFRRDWERARQKILKDPEMLKAMEQSTRKVKEVMNNEYETNQLLEEFKS